MVSRHALLKPIILTPPGRRSSASPSCANAILDARCLGQEFNCLPCFSWMTEPDDHEMSALRLRQPFCGLPAPPFPGAPDPPDRMAGPQHVPPALAIARPQLGAQEDAHKRTRNHPSHDHRTLVIEPHEVS